MVSLIASAAILGLAVALSYLAFWGGDYLLIIHFDSQRGIDWFGAKWDVLTILAVALLVAVVNFLLAVVFSNRDRFLAHILTISTVFLLILILIWTGVIIAIN